MNPEAIADLASILRSFLYEHATGSHTEAADIRLALKIVDWAGRYELSPQDMDKLYDRFHRSEDLRTIFYESMKGS